MTARARRPAPGRAARRRCTQRPMWVLLTAETTAPAARALPRRARAPRARPPAAAGRSAALRPSESRERLVQSRLARYAATARSSSPRAAVAGGHQVARLDVSASAIQPASVPTCLSSVPAASERRPPTCVRSGPERAGRAACRGSAWQAPQPSRRKAARARAAGKHRPARAPAPPGRAASARYVVLGHGDDVERHPRVLPAAVLRALAAVHARPLAGCTSRFTRPGIMSTLPASAGTQKLWMTLSVASAISTGRRPGCTTRWQARPIRHRRGVPHLPPP